MSSQLNVDTIVDKAGSGGTNVKIANTSVTVAEGGSATTNTVQGLAKMWLIADMGDNAIDDSLNAASLTDHATGKPSFSITNDFSSVNHSDVGLVGNNAAHIFYNGGNTPKSASNTGNFTIRNTGDSDVDISPYLNMTCHGDLA